MISQKDISYITKETNKIQNLYTEKNFEKVIEKTIKLLKKDPTQEIFYNLIGLSYRQLNNLEQAEKVFNQGLKIKPNSPSILVNLGAVYRAQGKYDEAKKTKKKVVCLGGINNNNIKKTKLIKPYGVSGISFFKEKI